MSHSVTITRTTTSTTTSALLINTGYFKTFPGLLKLAQVILGAVCVGISAHYMTIYRDVYGYVPQLFFLLMTTTFLIATACLFFSCLFSLSTATIIAKTLYELMYHSIAFILLLAASLTLLIQVNNHQYRGRYYEPYLAASIIGLVNSALYLLSAIFGYRSYRGI
ncbi:plasmolipin [Hetaerina americana]|uniref:plasmolipin n=1 Tax=Hetaerina americana TaxID=62018 RepID=UPI003A7F1997